MPTTRLGGPLRISAVLTHALHQIIEGGFITAIIGDVHGCLSELETLIEMISLAPVRRVIMLGDLVDKGPNSVGVVKFCREQGFELVLGNHEEKLLRWKRHLLKQQEEKAKGKDYIIPVKLDEDQQNIVENLSEEDWAYLATARPFIKVSSGLVAVHGGLQPGIPLEQQSPNVTIRLRVVDMKTGKMMPLNKDLSEPEGSIPWFDVWTGPESVVFGHRPLKEALHKDRSDFHIHGIDTSCVFGGRLTALLYNEATNEVLGHASVEANEVYANDPRGME